MVVMDGTGEPISEKKMSAFSVEDNKGDDEKSNGVPPTWRVRTKTKNKGQAESIEREDNCECDMALGKSVCGMDGITYPSICIAKCHKAQIQCNKGCPCKGSTLMPEFGLHNPFPKLFDETWNSKKLMKSLFSKFPKIRMPEMPSIPKEDQEWLNKE